MTFPSSILLIGAGNMGSALLSAWLRAGVPASAITVAESNPDKTKSLGATGVTFIRSVEEAGITPEVILLAVKPQSMDELLPSLAQKFGSKPLYISIAAGKMLGYFANFLKDAAIVRAMPNMPALIGKGVTALCTNAAITEKQEGYAETLLSAAGEVVWLEGESTMDAVTAISGSGPAYVFLFMEALVDAGMRHGLPESICRTLAFHTVSGSVELAKAYDQSLGALRMNVTSPGGTTEAALSVLMKNDQLKSLISQAVEQAVKRSKELA